MVILDPCFFSCRGTKGWFSFNLVFFCICCSMLGKSSKDIIPNSALMVIYRDLPRYPVINDLKQIQVCLFFNLFWVQVKHGRLSLTPSFGGARSDVYDNRLVTNDPPGKGSNVSPPQSVLSESMIFPTFSRGICRAGYVEVFVGRVAKTGAQFSLLSDSSSG